jgi:acyl carrier protein
VETRLVHSQCLPRVTAALRSASERALPAAVTPSDSLIFDLGFDSLAMARLGLTLEEQFGFPILLDSWLASESDPAALTVGSLCVFVESRIQPDESASP